MVWDRRAVRVLLVILASLGKLASLVS
jgi:hypothetical protein